MPEEIGHDISKHIMVAMTHCPILCTTVEGRPGGTNACHTMVHLQFRNQKPELLLMSNPWMTSLMQIMVRIASNI